MSEWETIDSAPKDGVTLLISDGRYIEFGYHERGSWKIINNGNYTEGGYGGDYSTGELVDMSGYVYASPTHWMPLPPPPSIT